MFTSQQTSLVRIQRYNEERSHRERLQEELRKQPTPARDRDTPAVVAPSPLDSPHAPTRAPPPIASTDVLLPTYCPSLVRRLDGNPNFKSKYRDLAKKQFVEELQDSENLGLLEVRRGKVKRKTDSTFACSQDRYPSWRFGLSNKDGKCAEHTTKHPAGKRTGFRAWTSLFFLHRTCLVSNEFEPISIDE